MCLSLVGVLYTIIFAGILLRTPEVNPVQRRSSLQSALGYTFLVIPILIFQVLLANKLDDDIKISYTAVVTPLFISFITLILMSFSAKGGNKCKYMLFNKHIGLALNIILWARITFFRFGNKNAKPDRIIHHFPF